MFKKFSQKKHISEDEVLWFLNAHSRKIFLTTVSEKIAKQLQIMGSTITSLSLKESLATENMIHSILCCVPRVSHLDLSDSQCTDKTMLCIQRMCPDLVSLNLHYCTQVTDQGMMNLCGDNKFLRYLDLMGTAVNHSGVSIILKGMPLLQHLKYYEMADTLYEIHKEGFEENDIHYNLTELIYSDLGSCLNILEVLRVWNVLCPGVTKLVIEFGLSQSEIIMCSRFENLEYLKIMGPEDMSSFHVPFYNPDDDIEYDEFPMEEDEIDDNKYAHNVLLPFIPRANRLTTLILTLTEIPTKLLMESFKCVKTLRLQNVTFTDFLEDDIKPDKTKLEELVLKEICLSVVTTYKAILLLLSVSKNVSELHLTCFKIVPEEIWNVILNSIKGLSFVNFSFTPINLPSVLRFFQIPSMTNIFLDGCWNISSFENADFKKMVSQSYTSTLSWCELNDADDVSDDESLGNSPVTTIHGYVRKVSKTAYRQYYNGQT